MNRMGWMKCRADRLLKRLSCGFSTRPSRVVFPALEDRLKARRCRLEPIDLRVGVETDSTKTERDRQLKAEGRRQKAEVGTARRPFLLVLLGDRYGWVPGEDRIKAAASEAGFGTEDERACVTALEIEYGLLKKAPAQRRHPQDGGYALLCIAEKSALARNGAVE